MVYLVLKSLAVVKFTKIDLQFMCMLDRIPLRLS